MQKEAKIKQKNEKIRPLLLQSWGNCFNFAPSDKNKKGFKVRRTYESKRNRLLNRCNQSGICPINFIKLKLLTNILKDVPTRCILHFFILKTR